MPDAEWCRSCRTWHPSRTLWQRLTDFIVRVGVGF